MSLQTKVMDALKEAMKAKDTVAMESLRAIKSAILLARTESGATEELSEAEEAKLLQKLVKQRKDSAELYASQGRNDLAEPELKQLAIIEVGATSMKDMGKVMGVATKQLAGKTDSKLISEVVKKLLS